jgi:hypothetical protein
VTYFKLLGLKIILTSISMGKSHGAIYLFMEFRNNHHRYVLSDSSDELNNIVVMTGMQYKRKQRARGHAAREGDQGWDSQQ